MYLIPPDRAASDEHTRGEEPGASLASAARPDERGAPPATDAPTGVSASRASVPLLSLTKLEPAPQLRPEDHAYTELQVDSAATRDPTSAAPEYPRWMLQKGIEGAASVLYVVDSTGLVDTTSYRVVSTTHPDFALAVQLALPAMRFRPAVQQGQAVRQLVQQSFRFRITRTDSIRAPNELPPAA